MAFAAKKRVSIEYCLSHPNRFVVAATNLFLYEIVDKTNEKFGDNGYAVYYADPVLSDGIDIKTNGVISDLNMKCFTVAPVNSDEVAVGLVSGRIVLTSFLKPDNVKEFIPPRHSRACNVVAWNPVLTHLISCGYDKVREDCSALVWDIKLMGLLQTQKIARSEKQIMEEPYSIYLVYQKQLK